MEHVARVAFPLGFLISLFATIMSLYYSYYLHIAPCELCWLQRIFIYPQVVLFGMAWYKKDTGIYDYIIFLSGIGLIIATYHH
jgi:disulfide bond formation protein DsbB